MRRAPRSLSGFVLLLALDGREPGPAHRVWFPRDYDAEFDAVLGRRPAPVADPTVYVHSPDDPAMRPDDTSQGWFVLVNAPPHAPAGSAAPGVDWDAPGCAERYADHVLAVLAATTVAVSMRIVGILLIAALMVLPVIAATRIARSMRSTLLLGMAIGLACVLAGLTVAYYADLPPGGTIVLLAAATFLTTSAVSTLSRRRL